MDSALRPRSVSEIVDATFRLLRRHYGAFVTYSLLAAGPQLLLQLFLVVLGHSSPDANSAGLGAVLALGGVAAFGILATLVYGLVMTGGFSALADEAVTDGAPDVRRAVGVGLRRAWACLGTGLLVGLAVGVGLLLLVVPGVYLAGRLVTALPTCVIEGVGPVEAVRRAWARGRGRVGHSLGVLLLIFVIYAVPGGGATILGTAVGASAGRLAGDVVQYAVSAVVTVLLQSLFPLATVLLYYDLRVRADGYDLEQMVDALGGPPGAPAPGAAAPAA